MDQRRQAGEGGNGLFHDVPEVIALRRNAGAEARFDLLGAEVHPIHEGAKIGGGERGGGGGTMRVFGLGEAEKLGQIRGGRRRRRRE